MKILTLACTICLATATPTFAESQVLTKGRALSEAIFGSIESNSKGSVDMGDFMKFGKSIFSSMDTNEDSNIEFKEFTGWDFGFDFIAEDAGQKAAYATAQRIIFAYWDNDRDGTISRKEFHNSLAADYRRADIDNDAFLTRQEFLDGYIVIDTYRAAIVGN